MAQSTTSQSQPSTATQWMSLCPITAIAPNTGVNALVGNEQVAIFRVGESDEVYAIGNYDPFSQAYVMSRGIIGDRKGVLKVASPIYKQNFNLKTGHCLDDETISLPTYAARVENGEVQVQAN